MESVIRTHQKKTFLKICSWQQNLNKCEFREVRNFSLKLELSQRISDNRSYIRARIRWIKQARTRQTNIRVWFAKIGTFNDVLSLKGL